MYARPKENALHMPICLYLLIARSISIDRETNNVSIFEMMEGVTAQGFPVMLPDFALLAVLRHKPAESRTCNLTLKVTFDGALLNRQQFLVNFEHGSRFRLTVRFAGLGLPNAGTLKFELEELGAETEVIVEGPPQALGTSPPGFRPLIPSM